MSNRRPRAKMNIPMLLACILLCLTMFSIYFCGGIYAKYTARGTGEDSARVAKFDVSDKGAYFTEDLLLSIMPNEPFSGKLEIDNNSEVAVAYTVTIENTTGNLPLTFSVNDSPPAKDICKVTTYLQPNTTDNTVTIVANWPTPDDENDESALQYIGMVDLVKLTITVEQVD